MAKSLTTATTTVTMVGIRLAFIYPAKDSFGLIGYLVYTHEDTESII